MNDLEILNLNATQDFLQTSIQLSLFEGTKILLLAFLFGLYLKFIYSKFGITYSSKTNFGNTILLTLISVASLVAVVKTSLALSLGLVGALSVIRFRTAVKEPYNLGFLLFAICIAISIGASQFIFTILILIFGTIAIIQGFKSATYRKGNKYRNNADDIDTIHITLPERTLFDEIEKIISDQAIYFSLISLDEEDGQKIEIIFNVKLNSYEELTQIKKRIFEKYPGSSFRFYNSPSI